VEQPDASFLRRQAGGEGIGWFAGLGDATPALLRDLERARAEVVASLPAGADPAGEVAVALRRLAPRVGRLLVAGQPGAPAGLDAAGALLVLVDRRLAWVGGPGDGAAIARVEGRQWTEALERVLLGAAATAPAGGVEAGRP
jgi:hypothetical protein